MAHKGVELNHAPSRRPTKMAKRLNPLPLYHYTVGAKLPGIRETRALLQSSLLLEDGEQGAVWFSCHPIVEPTARKGSLGSDGSYRALTSQETHQRCGGLYRFRLSPEFPTISFYDYKKCSGISEKGYLHLISKGRSYGANPNDWRVSFAPVNLEAIDLVERWNDSIWVPFQFHKIGGPMVEAI